MAADTERQAGYSGCNCSLGRPSTTTAAIPGSPADLPDPSREPEGRRVPDHGLNPSYTVHDARSAGSAPRGIVRARRCAPALTPLSASRPESLIRWGGVADSELPDLEPQVPVLDRRGRVVAHGDLGHRGVEGAGRVRGPAARRAGPVRSGRRPVPPHGRGRLVGAALRPAAPVTQHGARPAGGGLPESGCAVVDNRVGSCCSRHGRTRRNGDSNCPLGPPDRQAVGAASEASASGTKSMPASTRWASEIGVGAPVSGS